MLNSDYVPPAADDEKLNSPTKTPQKPQRPIEAKNLSSSMSVLEDISSQTSEVPALEDLEDEELAGTLLFSISLGSLDCSCSPPPIWCLRRVFKLMLAWYQALSI